MRCSTFARGPAAFRSDVAFALIIAFRRHRIRRSEHQGRSCHRLRLSAFRLFGGFAGWCSRTASPIVRVALRTLERLLVLEAGRHRGVGAGEDLVMLDIEGA